MHSESFDTIVIGGGITGLAAGFYASRGNQPTSRVLVLESASKAGGKIATFRKEVDGSHFLMEWGADSMLSIKPDGMQLVKELGLENELLETNRERQIFMLRKSKLCKMPEGLQLVVPKKLFPFAMSPLFTWRGKLRMGMDLFLPRRKARGDESVASFMSRRLGKEALELLAEPILSGIYSSNPERQSMSATFPQLMALEQKHRSLILGALAAKSESSTGKRSKSLFVSFKNGMQTLIDALAENLGDQLKLNTKVSYIDKTRQGFELALENGRTLSAKKVIVTTPASVSAYLLSGVDSRIASLLAENRNTSSGNVFLAYRREDVTHDLRGYGVLIPKVERRDINAVTWVSSKLEGRAPNSHVLFRAFFGGERRPDMMQLDDNEVVERVTKEISALHRIKANPVLTQVFRAENGNPQYDIGHLERVDKIEKLLPGGLHIVGCAIRGVGIPDCIRQAKEAALARS